MAGPNRFGIISELVCAVVLIFRVLALYRLFKNVDQNLAVLVVILGGVMPAVINFFNAVNDTAALIIMRGADFLSAFDKPQREALGVLFLRLHDQTNTGAELLWGLWLLPLALLVFRSRFLPRFLAIWLFINGFAYMTISFTGLLSPQYQRTIFTISTPALLGELAITLWLLIKGASLQPQPSMRSSSAA